MTVTASGSRTLGIPTTYHSTRFRSRLEARWAVFFDLIGWPWVYEPFDTEGWIPDFLILGPFPFLVEVGPCITAIEYIAKGEKARAAYPAAPILGPAWTGHEGVRVERWTLVAGVTPVYEETNDKWSNVATAAGFWAIDAMADWDSAALWYRCDECGHLGVDSPDIGGYLRPCGHAIPIRPAPGLPIFDQWAEAGNKVQWRSR